MNRWHITILPYSSINANLLGVLAHASLTCGPSAFQRTKIVILVQPFIFGWGQFPNNWGFGVPPSRRPTLAGVCCFFISIGIFGSLDGEAGFKLQIVECPLD